jgi:chromodomain-helicase-DNA-binding protein 1
LFKADEGTQTKKLDELDLDDILNRAEAHETEGADAGGASLGGEGFLQQFAAVQDVKADMSWDDIIPIEERTQVEVEQAQKEETENQELLSRRRAAASTRPGAYDGMDGEEEVRRPESSNGDSPPPQKKPQNRATGPKKTAAQRSLELKGSSISPSCVDSES